MYGIDDLSLAAALSESAQLLAADDLFDFDLDTVRPFGAPAAPAMLDEYSLPEIPMSCIAPLDEEVEDDPSSFANVGEIWVEIGIH
jgi:hypothetical protein